MPYTKHYSKFRELHQMAHLSYFKHFCIQPSISWLSLSEYDILPTETNKKSKRYFYFLTLFFQSRGISHLNFSDPRNFTISFTFILNYSMLLIHNTFVLCLQWWKISKKPSREPEQFFNKWLKGICGLVKIFVDIIAKLNYMKYCNPSCL